MPEMGKYPKWETGLAEIWTYFSEPLLSKVGSSDPGQITSSKCFWILSVFSNCPQQNCRFVVIKHYPLYYNGKLNLPMPFNFVKKKERNQPKNTRGK
jgi:hypothetical protein